MPRGCKLKMAKRKKIGLDMIALILGILAILFTIGMIIYAVLR